MVDPSAQNQDGSRELNCLIEGESDVFQVIMAIHEHWQVGNLQKEIKSTAAHTFKNVDAYNLVLCKVNINLKAHNDHSLSHLALESIEKEKLQSWASILHYWPDQPRNDHLHIIVRNPDKKGKTPEPTLDFGTIDKQIQAELKLLRPAVEAFLKAPELPTWDPPDNFAPDIKKFIKGLQIPTYRNGRPSLLFHKLDECDNEEITKIFGANTDMCICNTSGSGKTRRILEGLTKYWGFYLVAAPDVNGVGNGSLIFAASLLKNMLLRTL